MTDDKNNLEELARSVRKIIEDNRKFLDNVMAEDFDPGEDLDEDEETFEEL